MTDELLIYLYSILWAYLLYPPEWDVRKSYSNEHEQVFTSVQYKIPISYILNQIM